MSKAVPEFNGGTGGVAPDTIQRLGQAPAPHLLRLQRDPLTFVLTTRGPSNSHQLAPTTTALL